MKLPRFEPSSVIPTQTPGDFGMIRNGRNVFYPTSFNRCGRSSSSSRTNKQRRCWIQVSRAHARSKQACPRGMRINEQMIKVCHLLIQVPVKGEEEER